MGTFLFVMGVIWLISAACKRFTRAFMIGVNRGYQKRLQQEQFQQQQMELPPQVIEPEVVYVQPKRDWKRAALGFGAKVLISSIAGQYARHHHHGNHHHDA